MDVFAKAQQFNPNVNIRKIDLGPSRSFRAVQMLDNSVRNFPEHQIPARDAYEINNMWRYPAQGEYSGILQSGGQVLFRINEGTGSGDIERVKLRMLVQNTSSSLGAEYIPAPFWLKNHQFRTPNGEPIQTTDGTTTWLSIAGANDSDQWRSQAECILSNDEYGIAQPIEPLQYQEIEIDLLGDWISCGKVYIPWIKGDMYWYPNFQADNVIRLSGGQLNVVDMSLDMYMSNTDAQTLARRRDYINQMPVDVVVPYTRNQTFTQALQANSSYTFLLNGLTGDVDFMWFVLRNSYIGTDLMSFWPIASFQIQDSAGVAITPPQMVTDLQSRCIYYPRSFLGRLAHLNNVYFWSFANDPTAPLSLILNGLKLGSYPFTGNEKLVINTAPAGNNEVVTYSFRAVTTQTGATQTVTSPQLTVGGFYYFFSTPNGLQKTILINTTWSNAQVATAIEDINFFTGTVTVTGFPLVFTGTASGVGDATSISATATVTYTGAYALQPMEAQGYELYAQPAAFSIELTNGGVNYMAPVIINETTSTQGVWGIANGNTYILDIYAETTGILNIAKGGNPTVTYSS